MPPRRRCAVCGSKQFRKEPSSGLITCSEGHVLQTYRNETNEVTELGPHTMRKRALKSGRKKKEWQSKADPQLYHGERGRYHYYQCLQLLLRLQVAALIRAWHLPPEFEAVCRDIWALHLSLLPSPPPAEPYLHAQSQYGGQSPEADAADGQPARSKEVTPSEATLVEAGDHDDLKSSSSSSESSSDEEEEDPELEKLLRENSATPSSSSDEGENDGQPRPRPEQKASKNKSTYRPYDSPAGNIAVLMLTCWTLRLPVMYMDFKRLIENYELPYLDIVSLLPEDTARHLTKQTRQALSPQFPPTPVNVHSLASRLAKLMYRTYGVLTPEYNAAPALWRATRALQGTPTLYLLAKKLGKIVSLTLTLHYSLSPLLRRMKIRDPEHHKYDNAPPEVALIATVIVVLKLVYGLDGKKRTPHSGEDPACALPALAEYMSAIEDAEKSEKSLDSAMLDTSSDALDAILDLDEASMDKYLAFCQKALLPVEDRRSKNQVLDEFFPLPRLPSSTDPLVGEASQRTQANNAPKAMSATRLREGSSDLRPGQSFLIYNSQDILGALPADLEKIIQRASKWTGVDENYLCGVVERYERRLVRWWRDQRKADESDGSEV